MQGAEQLTLLVELVRQLVESQKSLQRYQQSQVPKYLAREYGVIANDVTLTIPQQSRNLERITSILVYTSSGPATLTLGRRTFSLSAGFTPITNIDLMLFDGDTRVLTQPVTGAMYCELMGEEMPTDGAGGAF